MGMIHSSVIGMLEGNLGTAGEDGMLEDSGGMEVVLNLFHVNILGIGGGKIMESQNGFGWKSPLWSSAPTIPPAAIPAFISVLHPGFS